MRLFLLVACVGVAASQLIPVPESAALAVRNAGIQILSNEIQQANKDLEKAVEAFKPINATCMTKYDSAISTCRICVESKCKARAESVCKPEEWQIILGKTINFFKDDIPQFFTKSIPDVFVDTIGGGVIDVTKDVGDFFEDKIGGGIIDAGKTIGNGVVDVGEGIVDFGKGIGDGIVDAGNTIGNVAVDGFNTVKDGINSAIDKIGDFGSSIGDAFKDLIGKRRLRELVRRESEPGCSQFESDASAACQFYLKPAYCGSCGFNPDTECPGYSAALTRIRAANSDRSWMTKVANQQFNIIEMKFNPTAVDPATGGFKDVQVKVHLFGKDLSFTVNQPVNPYLPHIAGPVIAQMALGLFKSAA